MKVSNFFSFSRSSFLTLDLFVLTTVVLAGLAGFARVVGLATLRHKQRNVVKGNGNSQNDPPDEDNYFG